MAMDPMELNEEEREEEQEFQSFERFEGKVLRCLESIYPAQMAIRTHAEIQTLLLIWIAILGTILAGKFLFF